jgi:Uri superfamily endonuclease
MNRTDKYQLLPKTGTYALILVSSSQKVIQIGRLGQLRLNPGYYIYIGSAFGPGGLKARISHHKRLSKHPRWHVDYLRTVTYLRGVWYTYDSVHREHQWAENMLRMKNASIPIEGFGSSDCICKSHLIFYQTLPSGTTFSTKIHAGFLDHDRIYISTNPSPPKGR